MLKIRFPDHRQEALWVVDRAFSIGSADDNHLVINDSSVSLQHARIVLDNDAYILHDLGSQNGTFVNAQRIMQKQLASGDKVRVGDVELEIIDPTVAGSQPEWTLVACSSWLMGQEFPVRPRHHGKSVKIGRASHCDLVFPGTHLSREHVQLTLSDQEVHVQDLNSANGTFINDVRVTEGKIYSGDQLRLDVYSFKIYGPGRRIEARAALPSDAFATRLRVPPAAPPTPLSRPVVPKQWKTRSTSPGNRSDPHPTPQAHQHSSTVKILAVLLSIAVVTLAVYLMVG